MKDNDNYQIVLEKFIEAYKTITEKAYSLPEPEDLLRSMLSFMCMSIDTHSKFFNRDMISSIKDGLLKADSDEIHHNNDDMLMSSSKAGYVRMPEINESYYYKLKGFLKKNECGIECLIIDLRGNHGGNFLSSLRIVELLCKNQPIIMLREKSHASIVLAEPMEEPFNGGIITLCDSITASSAEILIAALKNRSNSIIIGERTFGKGCIQTFLPLEKSDVELHITTAEFRFPNGRKIEGIGIVPDIEIKGCQRRIRNIGRVDNFSGEIKEIMPSSDLSIDIQQDYALRITKKVTGYV